MRNEIIQPPEKDQQQRYSPQQTAAIRKAAVQDVLLAQTTLLEKATTRTSLNNLEDVQRVTSEYIDMCAGVGIVPSVEGLCARLGLSRSFVYRFIREHGEDNPTAAYLNQQRLAWASARMALAERGMLDSPMSIFILRNSGLNFSNRDEPEEDVEDKHGNRPPWAWGMSDEQYKEKLLEHLRLVYDADEQEKQKSFAKDYDEKYTTTYPPTNGDDTDDIRT